MVFRFKKFKFQKLKIGIEKLKKFAYKAVNATTNELFPAKLTCDLCGKEIFSGENFCDDCFKKLALNDQAICSNCGRRTSISMERCFSCKGEWAVDIARSLYVYEGEVQTLIKRYKYKNERYLADDFVEGLKNLYIKYAFSADVVCGVPMTKEREYDRGFNQSEYLAEKLAGSLGVEFARPLYKRRETDRQAELSYEERVKNLKASFAVSDRRLITDKNVLIVDDVLTTGSTSGEMANVLKKAGAKSVFLLTIASTPSEI